MLRRLRRFAAERGGASAVEFALVALPFFLMIFGIIEFGRALWTRQALTEAAMNGARCVGLMHPGCAAGGSYSAEATRAYVIEQARGWGVVVDPTLIGISTDATCNGIDGFAEVTINFAFSSPMPDPILSMVGAGQTFTIAACFPNQA